jgi:hypothetical protein
MNFSHGTIFVPMNGAIPLEQTILLYILSLWTLIWKGLALWRASKQSQRNWFIVLLVLNTVGILDIIYLFRFSKDRMTIAEVTQWFKKTFASKKKSK